MTGNEYRKGAASILRALNQRQQALRLSDRHIAIRTGIGRTTLLRGRRGLGMNLSTVMAWAASMGMRISLHDNSQSGENVMPSESRGA